MTLILWIMMIVSSVAQDRFDINKCPEFLNICPGNYENCVNTPGSFEFFCICQEGFQRKGKTCEDINECADSLNICPGNEKCINTLGSYTCICQDGFQSKGETCEDINECPENLNICPGNNEKCINTPGSNDFNCICQEGFQRKGKNCEDINECAENLNICPGNKKCNNILGSYICILQIGFETKGQTCEGVFLGPDSSSSKGLGCIKFVMKEMTWSAAQANCNADGGSLLQGFNKQQILTIAQRIIERYGSIWYAFWVGVKEGRFVKSPSDDRPSSAVPDNLWGDGYPKLTKGRDCGCFDINPSQLSLSDDDCSDHIYSLCQILD